MQAYQQPSLNNFAWQGTLSVQHEGETFRFTGKQGHHIKTQLPSSEYQATNGMRVWLIGNGCAAFVEAD